MKKMSMACMMAFGLTIHGFPSTPITPLDLYLGTPEQKREGFRESLRDAKKLRECVLGLFYSCWGKPVMPEDAEAFKLVSGLSDAALEAALLDAIREYSAKGWHAWDAFHPSKDVRMSYVYLTGAIKWLGFCAEAKGKKLLKGVIMDNTKDGDYRRFAIDSYMCRADANERWAMIASFLADDLRLVIIPLFDVYHAAVCEYGEAEGDTKKRREIAAAVCVALAKEKNRLYFARGNTLPADWSKGYAESPQRKATLEKLAGIIMDNALDGEFRQLAINSYMCCANAKERWDMITRLFSDGMRSGTLPYFDVYYAAVWEYAQAYENPPKREMIVASVSAVLAKEQDEKAFANGDKLLVERSAEWAGSPQRKAALERFGKPPAPEAP